MSTLQEYISVIGCFQGFLLFVLLVVDRRTTAASRLLGGSCLVIASVFLLPFLLINADNDAVARTIGWIFYLPATLGSLSFLYCRSVLTESGLKPSDLIHVLPLSLCYALTIDIFAGNPQEMARWAAGADPNTWRLQASEYLLFAQAFIYAAWTMFIIWRYRQQANDNLANFNPAIFNWLLILQIFTFAVWFSKALPALTPASTLFADLANLLLVVLIYLIAMMQWRNPQLFTIPNLADEQPVSVPDDPDGHAPRTSGELDTAIRAELFARVKGQLENEELYLDNTLTLAHLAAATGLSKHHLSEVLNRHAGKNFYEFINGYRVDFVRQRFESEAELNVLDTALEAGFSSKSTFNAIFKQFTGQTPTQYRKAFAAQNA